MPITLESLRRHPRVSSDPDRQRTLADYTLRFAGISIYGEEKSDVFDNSPKIQALLLQNQANRWERTDQRKRQEEVFHDGDFSYHPQNGTIGDNGNLTPTENRVARYLYERLDEVVLYDDVLVALWGSTSASDRHTLRVHLSSLRAKMEEDPAHPRRITTVHTEGLVFHSHVNGTVEKPTRNGQS